MTPARRWIAWFLLACGGVGVWAFSNRYEPRGCRDVTTYAGSQEIPAGCTVYDRWTGEYEGRPLPR